MTARATFRQADLTRALKAAKEADCLLAGVEIRPDGSILLKFIEDRDEPKGIGPAEWK